MTKKNQENQRSDKDKIPIECEGCGKLFMAEIHILESDTTRYHYVETYCEKCEDTYASKFPGIPVMKLKEENKRYDGVILP